MMFYAHSLCALTEHWLLVSLFKRRPQIKLAGSDILQLFFSFTPQIIILELLRAIDEGGGPFRGQQ